MAAVACVLLPLRLVAGGGARVTGAARYAAFFAAIAIGFMAVEIALLQKFGLFLGHPNYALSVVLAALLLFSGVGALFSDAIVRALGRLRFVGYALVVTTRPGAPARVPVAAAPGRACRSRRGWRWSLRWWRPSACAWASSCPPASRG